jgi:hypothetical protein
MTISINNNITIKSLSIKCITVIFLFLATNQYCFSQDNLNEEELIEFNFITKSFNKSLPFDQFFSIKLLEIPDDSTDIAIRFYEYDLKAYRKLNFSMGSTVTQDQLKGALKIYEMTWERQSYSTDKTAEIPIPYLLKPNLKYIIEIKQTKKDKLSTEQKNTLAADLKSDLEISNLITNIGLEHLTVTNTIPSFANLDEYQAKINDFASRIVLKTNRYYRVDAIVLPHLIEISTYAKKFENIKFDLDNFSNNEVVDLMKDLTKKENIISDINAFKDKLSEINWGKVEPSDADFLALSFLKDKIFTAFPESDLQINSVKEEKLSIEEFIETILSQRDALLKIITDNIIADNTYISSTLDATYRTDFAKNVRN